MSRLIDDLLGLIVGDVRSDDITRQLYSTDSSIYRCQPLCTVFPKNTDDVVAAVRFAAQHNIPVHPRGSGTGISGDVLGEGIVLDFAKYMRRIFHSDLNSVVVEPGILVRRLNAILEKTQSRRIPAITGNLNATTIGSVIARNRAGRYYRRDGRIDQYVTALKVVLADGDVLDIDCTKPVEIAEENEAELNSTIQFAQKTVYGSAYTRAKELSKTFHTRFIDLSKYFIGTKGSLGIIVEATLNTAVIPQRGEAFALFFESIDKAVAGVTQINQLCAAYSPQITPILCELLDRRCLTLLRNHNEAFKQLIPAETEALLLVELETDQADDAGTVLREPVIHELCFRHYHIENAEELRLFDELLEQSRFALQLMSPPFKPVLLFDDINVPLESLKNVVPAIQELLQEYQITASLSGHIGQGHLRITPVIDYEKPGDIAKLLPFSDAVKSFLPPQYGQVDNAVKRLLDPQNILRRPAQFDTFKPYISEEALSSADLLDSGITSVDATPLSKQLRWKPALFAKTAFQCNNCGDCFRYDHQSRICPVFRGKNTQFFSPRSKAALARSVINGELDLNVLTDISAFRFADSCMQCRMCDTECPSKSDISQIAFEIKSAYNSAHGLQLDAVFFSRLDTILNVLTTLWCPVNFLLRVPFVRWLLEKTFRLPREQSISPLVKIPFLRKQRLSSLLRRPEIEYLGKDRVALFIDTHSNFFEPNLAELSIHILEHNGISVEVPPRQKPSGISAFAAGHKSLALSLVRDNTALMKDYIRQGFQIVTLEPRSATCFIKDYGYFNDEADTTLLSENVTDICTFLWRCRQDGKLQTDFKPLRQCIGYHAPCRGIALNQLQTDAPTPAELLLRLVPELEVRRLECGCCGGGGLYGFRKEHYYQSLQIGSPLFKALKDKQLDFGVSECNLCCLQMAHGSKKTVKHPVHVLAESYGV